MFADLVLAPHALAVSVCSEVSSQPCRGDLAGETHPQPCRSFQRQGTWPSVSKPNSLSVITYAWPFITFQKRFWVHAHC